MKVGRGGLRGRARDGGGFWELGGGALPTFSGHSSPYVSHIHKADRGEVDRECKEEQPMLLRVTYTVRPPQAGLQHPATQARLGPWE